jgi:hypothetical protein
LLKESAIRRAWEIVVWRGKYIYALTNWGRCDGMSVYGERSRKEPQRAAGD